MYNTEIKTRFIREFSTSDGRRHAATVMFNTIEPYEREWGSDFCTRGGEDVRPVVGEIIGFRTNSKKLRLTILREYVRWCMRNGVEGACDELLRIEDFGLEKLRRQTVANPQHLQRYLDCICEPESKKTVGCVYRCFYWLAYGGVRDDEDALTVRASEVRFRDMAVAHNGTEYPIYREAIPAFRNCIKLKEFQYEHPNYKKDVYKVRAGGDILLRGTSKGHSHKAVRVEMSRRANKAKFMSEKDREDESLKLSLSFYRVWLSGVFYRMYEAERSGMPVDFSAVARQSMEGKTYKLGRGLIGARERQLANDYLEDYSRWKEAYSI